MTEEQANRIVLGVAAEMKPMVVAAIEANMRNTARLNMLYDRRNELNRAIKSIEDLSVECSNRQDDMISTYREQLKATGAKSQDLHTAVTECRDEAKRRLDENLDPININVL